MFYYLRPPHLSICPCVCLFVCEQDNSKSYGWIFFKFSHILHKCLSRSWILVDLTGLIYQLFTKIWQKFFFGFILRAKITLDCSQERLAFSSLSPRWVLTEDLWALYQGRGLHSKSAILLFSNAVKLWNDNDNSVCVSLSKVFLWRWKPIFYRVYPPSVLKALSVMLN